VFCDMDIHGGGWSYVARGSNSLDFDDDKAFGTPQTDADVNTRWSFGEEVINELTAGGNYREILLTLGGNNNLNQPSHELFRLFRMPVTTAITMSDSMDVLWSSDIEVWDGAGWNALTITCGGDDFGPCWASSLTSTADDTDFCCALDSNNDLNVACQPGVAGDGSGAWIENGHIDGNQLFGCHSTSSDGSAIVMYVRNQGCISGEVPFSDYAEENSIFGNEGDVVTVTCDVGHTGGGDIICSGLQFDIDLDVNGCNSCASGYTHDSSGACVEITANTYLSCQDYFRNYPDSTSGVFTLNSIDLYCDMETHGGGWTYVARGSDPVDPDNADVYGTAQTDPDVNERWSFGESFINDVLTSAGTYREYYVTIGNNNGVWKGELKWRLFRVPVSSKILMSLSMDASENVEAWDGDSWVSVAYTCTNGVGPCWENGGVDDLCCSMDSNGDFTTCAQSQFTSSGGAFTDAAGGITL